MHVWEKTNVLIEEKEESGPHLFLIMRSFWIGLQGETQTQLCKYARYELSLYLPINQILI